MNESKFNKNDIIWNWKIISDKYKIKYGRYGYLCECQCENKIQKEIDEYSLVSGATKSCGCLKGVHSHLNSNFSKQSFYDWCIDNNHQDYLDRWNYDLNDVDPHNVSIESTRKFYFNCLEHTEHKPELHMPFGLTTEKNHLRCNQCNSFGQWCLDTDNTWILDRWDYELNDVDPFEISVSSSIKRYFKCPCGKHPSELKTIYSYKNGSLGAFDCKMCNSFGQKMIDIFGDSFLEKYWDYQLNDVDPFKISYGSSSKKVWIKCQQNLNHPSYAITPAKFYENRRCPICGRSLSKSKLHIKVDNYIKELGYNILNEHNCTIVPICEQNNYSLPYDTEVIELKLIIEVHGEQHYKLLSDNHPWLRDKTPEEYLKQRQEYDLYKKEYALKNGYHYLEIPYLAERNDEYKDIILSKINELKIYNNLTIEHIA